MKLKGFLLSGKALLAEVQRSHRLKKVEEEEVKAEDKKSISAKIKIKGYYSYYLSVRGAIETAIHRQTEENGVDISDYGPENSQVMSLVGSGNTSTLRRLSSEKNQILIIQRKRNIGQRPRRNHCQTYDEISRSEEGLVRRRSSTARKCLL